jgi:hypothetical protein
VSLRFHYALKRFDRPILTLGGRFFRPQPLIPITLVGPTKSFLVEAQADACPERLTFLLHIVCARHNVRCNNHDRLDLLPLPRARSPFFVPSPRTSIPSWVLTGRKTEKLEIP